MAWDYLLGVIVRFVRTETIQLYNNYFNFIKIIMDNSAERGGDVGYVR